MPQILYSKIQHYFILIFINQIWVFPGTAVIPRLFQIMPSIYKAYFLFGYEIYKTLLRSRQCTATGATLQRLKFELFVYLKLRSNRFQLRVLYSNFYFISALLNALTFSSTFTEANDKQHFLMNKLYKTVSAHSYFHYWLMVIALICKLRREKLL